MSTKRNRRPTGARIDRAIRDTVAAYHLRFVVPLEDRLAKLERPWWRKVLDTFKREPQRTGAAPPGHRSQDTGEGAAMKDPGTPQEA